MKRESTKSWDKYLKMRQRESSRISARKRRAEQKKMRQLREADENKAKARSEAKNHCRSIDKAMETSTETMADGWHTSQALNAVNEEAAIQHGAEENRQVEEWDAPQMENTRRTDNQAVQESEMMSNPREGPGRRCRGRRG